MGCFFVSKKHRRYPGARRGAASAFSAQHLLIHRKLIQEMIAWAEIGPADTVLDIGAGTGAITLPLAEKAGRVLAVENDPLLVSKLRGKLQEAANVTIKPLDILQMPLPKGPFKVVANIPYSITTPILGKLLDPPGTPLQRAVLLVEKGAARRFTSAPAADPRILAWRIRFELRLVRTVPPACFSPPPGVDSAALLISRRKRPLIPDGQFARFAAFAAHGLRNPALPLFAAFADVFTPPQIAKIARALGIARERPVGKLDEGQWGELFAAMLRHVEPYRWPRLRQRGRSGRRPQ
jgi:23S rRNA (adenine-N6)-dimethyltransferase